jgi:uncharacterized membrane protein YeiH
MITPVSLDLVAVALFALTGAIRASGARLDVIGFVFLACLTAVGGGTVRDLLLDRKPVFWVDTPVHILAAIGAALTAFLAARLLEKWPRALVWLDAVALSIATAAGVATAADMGHSMMILVIMGVVTGSLGGLMRDVVARKMPLLLTPGEMYAAAAFAGAVTAVTVMRYTDEPSVPALAGIAVTFVLRAGSLAFGWRLPTYHPK